MSSPADSSSSSFRVLGIALVVDQLGKGPRMVLRYPSGGGGTSSSRPNTNSRIASTIHRSKSLNSSTSSNNGNSTIRSNDTGGNSKMLKSSLSKNETTTDTTKLSSSSASIASSSSSKENDDLFFQLSGRQMSKLFRPKPSLCGQPITLRIDHTYFCCCAVLMNQNSNNNSTTGTSSQNSNSTENATTTTTNKIIITTDINDTDVKSTVGSTSAPVDAATTSITTNPPGKDPQLVLFSVVVALAPTTKTLTNSSPSLSSTMPFSVISDEMNHHSSISSTASSSSYSHNNPIFPCIRRVHIALARICRILEREERRCHYVSCQVLQYEQIRSELTRTTSSSSIDKAATTTPATTTTTHARVSSKTIPKDTTSATGIAATSPLSDSTDTNNGPSTSHATTNTVTAITTPHRRSGSFSVSSLDVALMSQSTAPSTTTESSKTDLSSSVKAPSQPSFSSFETTFQQQLEMEHILLETFMTAPSTRYVTSHDVELSHTGNLAQELAQIYHALAATHRCTTNHHTVPTRPPSNGYTDAALPGRDAVVYLNGHMAVTIEAVTTTTPILVPWHPHHDDVHRTPSYDPFCVPSSSPIIRPYMALLFPNNTADQILDSLYIPTYDGNTTAQNQMLQPPRRIQQFLQAWSPKKSLLDIAEETYVPLEATLDVAQQLVRQGLCIVSPVLSYSIHFVCPNIQRIQQMTLPFYQKFGIPNIHLFVLISYLTESNRSFGMSISQLVRYTSNSNNDNSMRDDPVHTHVRIPIVTSIVSRTSPTTLLYGNKNNNDNDSMHQAALEDILYQMIIWLCSRQVIVPLQEYIVLIHPNPNHMNPSLSQQQQATPEGTVLLESTPLTTRPTRSYSAPTTEERKYDEIRKGSSISTTTRTGSESHRNLNNDMNHTHNDDNDERIWQTLFNHCFHNTVKEQHPPVSSSSSSLLLLLECCYRTGIEERLIRGFVARHSDQIRIISMTSPKV